MTETNADINSWDAFTGSNFLKVEDVKDFSIPFVCVNVELEEEHQRPRLSLEQGESKVLFDLNVTNSVALKEAGVTSPKACIGKKIYFRKSMAFSPNAKKEVPTLRIEKVE